MSEISSRRRMHCVAQGVFAVLCAAGAVLLVVAWQANAGREVASQLVIPLGVAIIAGAVYTAAVAGHRGLAYSSALPLSPPAAGAAAAMALLLIALAAWTWSRGATSRLLLGGGSELLAVVTAAAVIQIALALVDWRMANPYAAETSVAARYSLTGHLLLALQLAAGAVLAAAWWWTESLALTAGSS